MVHLSLTSISDLDSVYGEEAFDLLLHYWDPAAELWNWSAEAARRGVQWVTEHTWNAPREPKCFHPSSLLHRCDMYPYLELVGVHYTKKDSPRMSAVYAAGTGAHLYYDYLFNTHAAHHGYSFQNEVPIKGRDRAKPYQLGCHADGLIERELVLEDKKVSFRAVVEIKSVDDAAKLQSKRTGGMDHRRQGTSYQYALDVPVLVILYVERERLTAKAFVHAFDTELWYPLQERMVGLLDLANRGVNPERNVGKSCDYCALLEECNPWKTTNLLKQE